jgi:hypothetical protein
MTLPHLELGFAGDSAGSAERPHLSVDGMTPRGPNLSHWPGNRTPARWKSDLSTGICFEFAAAPPSDQQAFLGDASVVLNDHYDTDGFLSLLAVLRPDVARPRQELCLAAAATGDFQVFVTDRAFAIDRTVLRLASDASPVGSEFVGLSGAEKALARYRWLLAHAADVLDDPESFAPLWRDELAEVRGQLLRAKTRDGVTVEHHRDEALCVVQSDGPMHRMVLNTIAGCFRVLHLERSEHGTLARFHDRTESWFELVTIQPPRRRDLRPLAQTLGGASGTGSVGWVADPPDSPIPELYFGVAAEQAYGEITRERRPIDRTPEALIAAVLTHLREAPPAEGIRRG